MKPLRKFYPDLQACELEARLLPVIANLGVIVLTTGGYILMIPSPGAAAYPGASPAGTAIPTSFFMTAPAGYPVSSRVTSPASPASPRRGRPERAGVPSRRSPSARGQ
jgi:hypothetical protein